MNKHIIVDERRATFGRIADHLNAIIEGQPLDDHLPAVKRETLAAFVTDDDNGIAKWLLERLRRVNDALEAGAEPQTSWWLAMEAKAREASEPKGIRLPVTGF